MIFIHSFLKTYLRVYMPCMLMDDGRKNGKICFAGNLFECYTSRKQIITINATNFCNLIV